MILPVIGMSGGYRTVTQTEFRGYDHRPAAEDGSLWDMENLSGRYAPALSPRAPRGRLQDVPGPQALFAGEKLCWAADGGFWYGGERKGELSPVPKRMAELGGMILIFPDGAFYEPAADVFGSLGAEVSFGGAIFEDGTLYGVPAAANTLRCDSVDFSAVFSPGDGVTISGCAALPENNLSIIVREISEDGHRLRFYENSFTAGSESGTVTVKREVPALEHVCVNDNRLWGCSGDTIHASKLGDPRNFNVFDGLSTDAWASQVGERGPFTGCVSYQGYPIFFTEEGVYKVYGDRPSNYAWTPSARLGVAEGSGGSLAVAGETLFYLSRAGVAAYGGGMPEIISAALGEGRLRSAVAGSDGLRYYISVEEADGRVSLFVYDTARGMWHREDGSRAVGFAFYDGSLHMLREDGSFWRLSGPEAGQAGEGRVVWMAETGDFSDSSPRRKQLLRLLLRGEMEAGSHITVEIAYDSGPWQRLGELEAREKRSFQLPLLPRRTDHYRLRLRGEGQVILYSLARERAGSSERP